MARCPQCQTEQSADFGMTTCTQCSAVFMVGIDGEVASAEAVPPEEEDFSREEHTEEPTDEPHDEVFTSLADDVPMEQEAVYETVADTTDESVEGAVDESEANVEYSENFLDDLSSKPKDVVTPGDPLDVQKFDQSVSSQVDEGEYIYEVIMTGIDSADLKKDVLMALSEKRFSLIMSDLQKEIQKGELIVRNLNPVRAMLIVLRLQSLDITVEWRQKHFTQNERSKRSEAEA